VGLVGGDLYDAAGLTDEVHVTLIRGDADDAAAFLDAGDDGPAAQNEPPLPTRPPRNAGSTVWLRYVAALGADPGLVGGAGRHWDAAVGGYVTHPALTRDQLIDLADRLGG
jgi:hypothetical protein